jgi:hypothetical protein
MKILQLLSRDHEDGRACPPSRACSLRRGGRATAGCWFPYLNGASQGPTPEDARKNGHIIRARYAPLSPASGFPVSWSQQVIHEISGLIENRTSGSEQSIFTGTMRHVQGKNYDWAIVDLVGMVPQSYSEFGTKVRGCSRLLLRQGC